MKSKISQLMGTLYAEKNSGNAHCDVTSSKVRLVNVPIPVELFDNLDAMSSEYNRDLDCLAGDFLALALEEAIDSVPKTERAHLSEVRLQHDCEAAELKIKQCAFNAGGT